MAEDVRVVRGTPDYVLFTGQLLGRGAMGKVVIARHRRRGTTVAAKIFTSESRRQYYNFIQRELDILQSIPPHDNIIKFIDIQKDNHTGEDVVIMELCENGSLQQLLDQPQHYYGLHETQYMLLFQHLNLGLQHLHANQVVHRDIKPGNVLISSTPDGRVAYKLADFGTSKQLSGDDDDQLKTMCGTEEYLNPNMHARAFVRRSTDSTFGGDVDLWSVAVTLYQSATGKLPYRPKKGVREDKRTMNKLMMEKSPGVISKIETDDGELQEFTELPVTCHLTRGTRRQVTIQLAHLMDMTQPDVLKKTGSLYRDMAELLSRRRLKVFSVNLCETITLYLKRDMRWDDVLNQIKRELPDMTPDQRSHQVLLFINHLDVSVVTDMSVIWRAVEHDLHMYHYIPDVKINDIKFTLPRLETAESPETAWTREVFGNILYYIDVIKECIERQSRVTNACMSLRSLCSKTERDYHHKRKMCQSKKDWLEKLSSSVKSLKCMSEAQQRVMEDKVTRCNAMFIQSTPTSLLDGKLEYNEKLHCQHSRCLEKAEVIARDVRPMYETLLADRKRTTLNHNEREIHKYYRKQLSKAQQRLANQVKVHCVMMTQSLYHNSWKYISNVHTYMNTLSDTVLNDILRLQDECQDNICQYLGDMG